jgi:predicted ATPase/class 3 adenylate cyclase
VDVSVAASQQDLPTGEVTFLFADIEQSTRAWEERPAAMASALVRHGATLRDAVVGHGGCVVKDTGDGAFAVFSRASDGVAAAVAAQAALAGASWSDLGALPTRMGLHTAEADPVDGDYHGAAVNRCARIMGAAHGGQILVSEATEERSLGQLPSRVSFVDLGSHRLRDLSDPIRLFQVLHPDLEAVFPPPRSLDAVMHNLPAELSSFVGRADELSRVAGLLDDSRLLTLTGAGGVGKTRLALQLAAHSVEGFADGVWLVDLSGVGDPDLVAAQLAADLGVGSTPGHPPIESAVRHLRDRRALVVFDNCEHLLDTVASVTTRVLRDCSAVKILATSREALGVPGETAWRVPPLRSGGNDGSEAVELFVRRAQEAEPTWQLTTEDRAAVKQVCERLDGVPLAIELAAVRVRMLAVSEIAARLDDRFVLLLEATVTWSYELLEPTRRRLFARLAVFAGSFTLDAAEQVGAVRPEERAEVLDLLTGLVDRSLVVRQRRRPPSRYRLLETMRAYARGRLAETDEVPVAYDRLLTWANEFARAAAPGLDGPDQREWLDRVADELDNIRAALTWSLNGGDSTVGLACAATLYRFWYSRSVREGRLWLDRLLDAADDPPPAILAKALYTDGSLSHLQGDDAHARPRLQQSLDINRARGNDRGVAWALHGLGMIEWGDREPEAVRARFAEALDLFRGHQDPIGVAFTLMFLTAWEATFGDRGLAIRHAEEFDGLVRPTRIPELVAHSAEFCGLAHAFAEPDAGRDELREALDLYREVNTPLCTAHCLQAVAWWAERQDRHEDAALLLGAMDRLRAEAGTPMPPYAQISAAGEQAFQTLGEHRYRKRMEQGGQLDLDAAVDAALGVLDRT